MSDLSLALATTNRNLTSFPRFSKLPTELQLKVWEYAAIQSTSNRLVRLEPQSVPVLLHTCHDARNETLKFLELFVLYISPPEGRQESPSIYINAKSDVVYLDQRGIYNLRPSHDRQLSYLFSSFVAMKVENLMLYGRLVMHILADYEISLQGEFKRLFNSGHLKSLILWTDIDLSTMFPGEPNKAGGELARPGLRIFTENELENHPCLHRLLRYYFTNIYNSQKDSKGWQWTGKAFLGSWSESTVDDE